MTTLENASADRASSEIALSTDSDSSDERSNGLVSTSNMLVNVGSMNQESNVYLADTVEDSDKEGGCS